MPDDSIAIMIATEDLLGESVSDRLLLESGKNFNVINRLRQGGFGYLQNNVEAWNNSLVRAVPLFLLTDLDTRECAPIIIHEWMKGSPLHSNLLFRVAVREVEAWLMADREQCSQLLGVSSKHVPASPDDEPDPKQKLINVARKSTKRHIREGLLPLGSASIGPEYNAILSAFVQTDWRPSEAVKRSDSLRRAVAALHAFRPSSESESA